MALTDLKKVAITAKNTDEVLEFLQEEAFKRKENSIS